MKHWQEELNKVEEALTKETNLNQISFYEGYIKGLKFITYLRKKDEEELIKIIGTFTPTCGYESEEEKGYQKGIQAEQSLVKRNLIDYYEHSNNN